MDRSCTRVIKHCKFLNEQPYYLTVCSKIRTPQRESVNTVHPMERISEGSLLKDARRLLAVNAGEQKRLEKFQRHIDNKRRERERMLIRAQKNAILKYCESSGKGFEEFSYVEKNKKAKGHDCSRAVVSSDVLKSHETMATETETKAIKTKQGQNRKISLHKMSSKGFCLPELELKSIFSLKDRPFNRTRSWSSPPGKLEVNNGSTGKERGVSFLQVNQREQDHYKRKMTFEENCENANKEQKKTEKPLSDILPPLVLPPLHLQRRLSLQEQNKSLYWKSNSMNEEKSLKKQYEELSDCRYLRNYQP